MQSFTVGQANTLTADVVARDDGTPIVAGTVTGYLRALSGTNAGKWFRASDSSWQAGESSAGAMTHAADGHWSVSLVTAAWTTGVRYSFYAKESGDLHIPLSEEVIEDAAPLILGAVGGKKIVNAAGTQVQVYNRAGVLLVTLDRTGAGPFVWTPVWS